MAELLSTSHEVSADITYDMDITASSTSSPAQYTLDTLSSTTVTPCADLQGKSKGIASLTFMSSYNCKKYLNRNTNRNTYYCYTTGTNLCCNTMQFARCPTSGVANAQHFLR